MFAYCGNNPVCRKDAEGQFWIQVLIVVVCVAVAAGTSGCSNNKSRYGAARDYTLVSGGAGSPNCYGYAIGVSYSLQPGSKSGIYVKNYNDIGAVGAAVMADLRAMGYSVRKIDGPNSKIYDYEYRIALRVGTKPYGYLHGKPLYDYHFMVQMSDGRWSEKHGTAGASIIHDKGKNPNNIVWTLYGQPYYDSKIIYYAIGKR